MGFLVLDLLILFSIYDCFACICVYTVSIPVTHEGQWRGLDPSELALHMALSHHESPRKSSMCSWPSLQPLP